MQFAARASIRAIVVFPVPRGPENKYAWVNRSEAIALRITRITCSCPTNSSQVRGRHFRYNACVDNLTPFFARTKREMFLSQLYRLDILEKEGLESENRSLNHEKQVCPEYKRSDIKGFDKSPEYCRQGLLILPFHRFAKRLP